MRGRTLWVLVLGSLALPLLPGCFFFDIFDEPGSDPWVTESRIPEPYNDGSLLVHSSAQFGDMGRITNFSADAVVTNASYYGRGASIRLDSVGSGWWVMSALYIDNFDIVNAPAGTYRVTSQEWNGTDPSVSVTGCSGPSYGNWDFDESSSDVELVLADNGDGTRTLEFTVRYNSGRQATTGSVVFEQGTYSPPTYSNPTPIRATNVSQQGTMGQIATYASAAEVTNSYYYGSSSSIRLDSIGSDWWVMSAINIGNLDLATAAAGTYRSVVGVYDDPNDPQVSVTGCSGPSYGNYTYDAPSDETEIVLTDNADGSRSLEVTAFFTYNGERQVARARFDYVVDTSGTLTY